MLCIVDVEPVEPCLGFVEVDKLTFCDFSLFGVVEALSPKELFLLGLSVREVGVGRRGSRDESPPSCPCLFPKGLTSLSASLEFSKP